MMAGAVYRSGPPPSVGWWPTCREGCASSTTQGLRWWNGVKWSRKARPTLTAQAAAALVTSKGGYRQHTILWSKRPPNWPKESRT